jgi:hypothetical protein
MSRYMSRKWITRPLLTGETRATGTDSPYLARARERKLYREMLLCEILT